MRLSNLQDVDPRIITTRHHRADIDMGKIDSTVPNLKGDVMYEEVKDFVRLLFFRK